MYNHYIPQSDGSYRRSSVPEHNRNMQIPRPVHPAPSPAPPPPSRTEVPEPCRPEQNESHDSAPCFSHNEPQYHYPQAPIYQTENKSGGIMSFLKGLLPREIDTDDLLIILLIILMNRDEDCDGLSPILTLALYFLL